MKKQCNICLFLNETQDSIINKQWQCYVYTEKIIKDTRNEGFDCTSWFGRDDSIPKSKRMELGAKFREMKQVQVNVEESRKEAKEAQRISKESLETAKKSLKNQSRNNFIAIASVIAAVVASVFAGLAYFCK